MTQFYPTEFSRLHNQLENYIMDVRSSEQFSNLDGISDLSKIMVQNYIDPADQNFWIRPWRQLTTASCSSS